MSKTASDGRTVHDDKHLLPPVEPGETTRWYVGGWPYEPVELEICVAKCGPLQCVLPQGHHHYRTTPDGRPNGCCGQGMMHPVHRFLGDHHRLPEGSWDLPHWSQSH